MPGGRAADASVAQTQRWAEFADDRRMATLAPTPTPPAAAPCVLHYADGNIPASKRSRWPVVLMVATLGVIALLQSQLLPCACANGKVKVNAGYTLDGLIMARVALAVIRQERNLHWTVYLVLAATSIIWIPMVLD